MEPEPILPSAVESPRQQTDSLSDLDMTRQQGRQEHQPPTVELQKSPQLSGQPLAPVVPQPVVSNTTLQPMQQSQDPAPQTSSPAIADDVDVIEKEWVDKAKKIVSSTKTDPHKQEKQVSQLQADYLMKRYGKQIKTVE